jgi:hypothetical protein
MPNYRSYEFRDPDKGMDKDMMYDLVAISRRVT